MPKNLFAAHFAYIPLYMCTRSQNNQTNSRRFRTREKFSCGSLSLAVVTISLSLSLSLSRCLSLCRMYHNIQRRHKWRKANSKEKPKPEPPNTFDIFKSRHRAGRMNRCLIENFLLLELDVISGSDGRLVSSIVPFL